jgi:hypothetical protein
MLVQLKITVARIRFHVAKWRNFRAELDEAIYLPTLTVAQAVTLE